MHTYRRLFDGCNPLSAGDAVWYQTQGKVLVLTGTALGIKSAALEQHVSAYQVGAGQEQPGLIFVGSTQVARVTCVQVVSLGIHCFGATADHGDFLTGCGREE